MCDAIICGKSECDAFGCVEQRKIKSDAFISGISWFLANQDSSPDEWQKAAADFSAAP